MSIFKTGDGWTVRESEGWSRRRPGIGVLVIAAALALGLSWPAPVLAAPPIEQTVPDEAALAAPAQDLGAMLAVLGDADVELYRRIFDLQDQGKWGAADKLIPQLSDRSLLGHVLFDRFMDPHGYRSSYEELKDWMAQYADHPGAERVYKLAVKRRPQNWNWPREPRAPLVSVAWNEPAPEAVQVAVDEDDDGAVVRRRYGRDLNFARSKIRRWLRMGAPTRALEYLSDKGVSRHFDTMSYDEALTDIGVAYFHAGQDEKALATVGAAADRSGRMLPESRWWAGLAAWRLGRTDVAAGYFEALARSRRADDWLASAGAYWAARAYLVGHQPGRVGPMLKLAADRPMTFYGVLGQEALAIRHTIDWDLPDASPEGARALLGVPAARRGLALLQIGEEERAVGEFKRIAPRLPTPLLLALMGFADDQQFAALAYQLGNAVQKRDGRWHGAALFPMPALSPRDGFQIDRALLFALIRQESNFKTNAKSRSGARGLMQLMPGTAGFMSGTRYRGNRREELYDPELNVTLGQKYIRYLLESPEIGGNLFMAVAAYNGGPGNLRKWLRNTDHRNDPLLFIESIPANETRVYVERVVANYWLYRDRMNQPRPSLQAVVAGDWPVYSATDPLNGQVALSPAEPEAKREN